jgi:tricorn protease interacting factor F2/3
MKEKPHKTLGRNVVPSSYRLSVEPDMKAFRYRAHIEISVGIGRPTKTIKMNSKELKIRGARLLSKGMKHEAAVRLNDKDESLTLSLDRQVAGEAVIVMDFEGVNNDEMCGFYRSRYMEGKKERYLLSSQFEPADARRAFPCFDEPEFKAVFEISMVVGSDLECVSNMPVRGTERLAGGRKRVRFLPTPRMSTYLLYLGVGDYDEVTGSVGKLKLRALATRGNKDKLRLPLSYAKEFIKYYERYFGVRYSLPKLDLLAIPDFAAGAMENWGAIAFREQALLADEKSAISFKQNVAEGVAHEIAHMWFGDLVTMKWWDDIWLNESFATFMSHKAMESVMPEWDIPNQVLENGSYSINSALVTDQLRSTHAINASVSEPAEINAMFDVGVSYSKGMSVLGMLEDYLGAEVFRGGLHRYLKAYGYGNATKHELWKALDDAAKSAKKSAKSADIARYWIDEPGYPMVSVARKGDGYALTQRRFIVSSKGDEAPSRWPIPVHYLGSDGREGKFLMPESSRALRSRSDWIKINYRQKGFYRVEYDPGITAALGEAMRKGKLSGADEWGIENDLFIRARAGRIPASEYLDFAERYCLDCGDPANISLLGHMNWLYGMLYTTRLAAIVRKPLVAYARKTLERLGMEFRPDEKPAETMLRSAAFATLGFAEDKETVERAKAMFDGFVKGSKPLDRNMRRAVYMTVAWNYPGTFEKFVSLYKKESVIEDKLRFLGAIGAFRETALLRKALSFALSKEVRYQDVHYIPSYAAANPYAQKLLWKWVSGNWARFLKRYPPGTHMVEGFASLASGVSDAGLRDEIASFFGNKKNLRGDFGLEARRALERIDTNIRFMKANGV